MIDRDSADERPEGTEGDHETIGRPNWAARDMASEEEDDDWMMEPPSAPVAATATAADERSATEESNDGTPVPHTENPSSSTGSTSDETGHEGADADDLAGGGDTDRMDPSRFDLEDGDANDGGDETIRAGASQVADTATEASPQSMGDDSEAQALHDEYGASLSADGPGAEDASGDRHESGQDGSSSVRDQEAGPGDEWKEAASRTVDRWSALSLRHSGKEAFKTGLVLPLLNSLGYDTFDPDQVEPLEDESGQHDGYLAKGPGGELVVLLADTEVADDHRDKVAMRARRDRVTIGIRIPNEDGEGSRWQAVIEIHLESGSSVSPLACVHRENFDPDEISSMARQMHGQQEHILEAMRRMILAPGAGFVDDVRRAVLAEGHSDPAMLSERMALLASKLFVGDEKDEVDEDDDKTRQITPSEQQALEHIRRICGPEIAPERIVGRPAQSYLAVLLDNNNRRTIARLHFSAASRKHIGVFEGRDESRHAIGGPSDVGEYSDELRGRARELDPSAFPKDEEDAADDGQEAPD